MTSTPAQEGEEEGAFIHEIYDSNFVASSVGVTPFRVFDPARDYSFWTKNRKLDQDWPLLLTGVDVLTLNEGEKVVYEGDMLSVIFRIREGSIR